jgi:hypothetical protein
MCPCAKCSILVSLQDAMFDSFFAFYVVNSPAKRVRSAVVFARRVLDFELILSEEFRPSHLSTVKNFGGCES